VGADRPPGDTPLTRRAAMARRVGVPGGTRRSARAGDASGRFP